MVALFCRERRRRRWCRSRWKRGACCCRRAPQRGCAPSRTTSTTYRRSEAAEEDRCCSAAASSKEPPYWSFFEAGYVEAASCSHPRNFFLRSTPCISCRPTGKGNSSFSLLRSRRRIDLVPRGPVKKVIEKVNNDGDEHDERETNREKEVNYHLCAFATIDKN